jgi:hypothetical protein
MQFGVALSQLGIARRVDAELEHEQRPGVVGAACLLPELPELAEGIGRRRGR